VNQPIRHLAAAVALAALAVTAQAVPAAAAPAGGNGQFGLTPVPDSAGRVAPYFMLAMAAGQSVTDTALISNLGQTAEKLRLSGATGVTAGNGGSAFSQEFQSCSGTGCWISGLAAVVTLPAGAVERVPFKVRVPAGTPPGQYLAGLTVEAAALPPSVQVGSNGRATARAVIIKRVTVGVAVTVGAGSRLTTRLAIPGVSGQAIGPTARLNIELANTGQTFAHGTGKASCTAAGKSHSFAVYAATVLPHDQAVIAVNAPGLPKGVAMPCTVRLRYGNSLTASWAGQVTVPAPPSAKVVHTGPGAYSVVPAAGTPAWAVALLVIGALVLAALSAVLLRLHRRSRVT
jgi:WxL Interacting Protein, peptidoglycan binding domain